MKYCNINKFNIFMIIFIFLLFLYIRFPPYIKDLGDLIWAEDGRIFLSDAYSAGLKSIVTPYASYLHLYPRIISIIIPSIGIEYSKFLFLAAWIAAAFYFFWIFTTRLIAMGVQPWKSFLCASVTAFQPNSGEIFFNLTNCQWFLGGSLAIIVCVDSIERWRTGIIVIFIMSLTGPFSILLIPAIIIRASFEPQIRKAYIAIIVLFSCSLVQLWFIFHGKRIYGEANKDITVWVFAFLRFLTFHAKNWPSAVVSGGIVSVIIFGINRYIYSIAPIQRSSPLKGASLLALIVSIFFIYFSGLWSSKIDPLILSPIGGGGRYFWIPYSLSFFAISVILSMQTVIFIICYFLLSLECFINFSETSRDVMNFTAFAEFSKINKNFKIPINPLMEGLNGYVWFFETKIAPVAVQTIGERLKVKVARGVLKNEFRGTITISANDGDPEIVFYPIIDCGKSKYVGVRFVVIRKNSGYTKLFWLPSKSGNDFSNHKSIRLFYPSGKSMMYFAFPYNPEGVSIRFDPSYDSGKNIISSAKFYCLAG